MNRASAVLLAIVLLVPTAAFGLSISTADTYVPTYGQAVHYDQYNEWLGASSSAIDGLAWDPFQTGGTLTITLDTNVGAFYGTGDYEYFSLWIDWDQNGLFDTGEEVIDIDDTWYELGVDTHVFDIAVPGTFTGATWMRSRIAFGQNLMANDNLMGGMAYFGEVEDYLIEAEGGQVIPEPATVLLLGVGLLGLAGLRRRTRAG